MKHPLFLAFLFYLFMLPLEYYQEKLPKGPTGINYRTLTLLALIAGWMMYRARKQRPAMVRSPLNTTLVVYLFLVLFGMMLGTFSYPQITAVWDPGGETFKRYLGILNGVVIFWAAAALLDTQEKVRYAMLALCASVPITFRAFYNDFAGRRGWHFTNDMRAALPFVSVGSNELGAYLVVMAIAFLIWAFAKHRLWERSIFLTGFAAYTYCIMYSFSRASQLGFGAALGMLAVLRHRWMIIVIVFAAVTANLWLPVSVRERWTETRDEEGQLEESAESRKEFWALAMDLFSSSPVFGHGFSTFRLINPAGMDTHNLYLRTLAEQGLIGGVVLILIWAQLLHMSVGVWLRARDPSERQIGLAVFAATIALMICNVFGDRFTYVQLIGPYWVLAGIVARYYAKLRGWEAMADETAAKAVEEGAGETPGPSAGVRGVRGAHGPSPIPVLTPTLRRSAAEAALQLVQSARQPQKATGGQAAPDYAQGPAAVQTPFRTPGSIAPLVVGAAKPGGEIKQPGQAPEPPAADLKIAGRHGEPGLNVVNPQP